MNDYPSTLKDYLAMAGCYALSACLVLMGMNPEWVYELILGVTA